MTTIRRSTPPPTHQAATTQHAAATPHTAAAAPAPAAASSQGSQQTSGGKDTKSFSNNMQGPKPGPRQSIARGGVKGKKSSKVGKSRRKSRGSPISEDGSEIPEDDDDSTDDVTGTSPLPAAGGGEMGDTDGGDKGSRGEQSKQDRKSKQGALQHSLNMGNYARGGLGGIKFGSKLPIGEALVKREVVLLQKSVEQLAKVITAPVKLKGGETHRDAWGKRIGEIKKLGLKVSRELGKLGVTHFDHKRMPSTKELMLKFFPKPDRSKGPPSEEQASLNRMAWMIVHTFRRIRTPQQAKLNRAHLRVRFKQRNRNPAHG